MQRSITARYASRPAASFVRTVGNGRERRLGLHSSLTFQRAESRLTVLLLHLAKWRFQPGLRGRSWRLTIEVQRLDLADVLDDNPSLRPLLGPSLDHVWRRASLEAQRETDLDPSIFPKDCPWTPEQVLDDGFWPE